MKRKTFGLINSAAWRCPSFMCICAFDIIVIIKHNQIIPPPQQDYVLIPAVMSLLSAPLIKSLSEILKLNPLKTETYTNPRHVTETLWNEQLIQSVG